ncbi:unnamed protein product [Clonostachys byssicola]|uniref:Proline iminopeptidase n=1 Tax=Clonostachys byssicola TaxID=160290 RepID=A0A9N9XTL8_9HYPO|nr:unnamed protein product [Clonostachys byssicola]
MASPNTKATGYSHSDAFNSGFLPVGSIHKLWYAEYGLPTGRPVLFLHGGPGGGTSPSNTAFFDPKVYRVVLMDQRGGGKSTPAAEIRENTTQHLVDDIEKLREHLGITQWAMVFGGSWGSTLALAYAEAYPETTLSLVLRGIFTVRESELANAFSRYGAVNQLYPEEYDEVLGHLKANTTKSEESLYETRTLLTEYYRLLTDEDPAVHLPASRAWNKYEITASTLLRNAELQAMLDGNETWNLQHARIECHYFINGAWLEDGQLLKPSNLERIKHIPCHIVQGRYDIVCPPRTAQDLHLGLPQSKLHIIPDAGHSANEVGTKAKLIEVCDEIAKL